jgi:hypothetical protein
MWRRLLFIVAILFTIGLTRTSHSYAATPSSNDVGVSPAITNLVLRPGQNSISYQATLTNNSSDTLSVNTKTEDFTSYGLNATLAFLPASQSGVHELADSLSTANKDLLIPPHTSSNETVTVSNANSLQPGGHYAAVLFEVNSLNKDGTSSTVSIHRTLASLVFLSTRTQGTYKIRLLPVKQGIAWFQLPKSTSLVFSNTGNVQTEPRGYIVITNPRGKLVSKSIINSGSALILPGTARLLPTPLTSTSLFMWPGRYTMYVYYQYDGASNFQVMTQHFIYVNVLFCLFVLIILVFIGWCFRRYVFRRKKQQK